MTDRKSRMISDLITKRHDDKLRKFGIIIQPKLKPVRPFEMTFEVTTPTDQHEDRKKVLKLSSIPPNPETTTFLEKGLNLLIQHHRSLLGDILVEIINIADKFREKTKREIEMELIPKILIHQEPTHRNIFAGIRKTPETNGQLVLQADRGGATVIIDKKQYTEKMERILRDRTTYRILNKDSTMKINGILSGMLKDMHRNGEIDAWTRNSIVRNDARPPTAYELEKIHKEGEPLRRIVNNKY
ncbi:unnamed protein product [Protopolystoma xenopodis]|uniref:Uncharacterized protein n=1 Tax=Protopolystoma xenopodis TaxID=117903 RepID=A0A3S5APR4_9PLAT|nr:unnamed protein product [Protopolystoma xenopodis]